MENENNKQIQESKPLIAKIDKEEEKFDSQKVNANAVVGGGFTLSITGIILLTGKAGLSLLTSIAISVPISIVLAITGERIYAYNRESCSNSYSDIANQLRNNGSSTHEATIEIKEDEYKEKKDEEKNEGEIKVVIEKTTENLNPDNADPSNLFQNH